MKRRPVELMAARHDDAARHVIAGVDGTALDGLGEHRGCGGEVDGGRPTHTLLHEIALVHGQGGGSVLVEVEQQRRRAPARQHGQVLLAGDVHMLDAGRRKGHGERAARIGERPARADGHRGRLGQAGVPLQVAGEPVFVAGSRGELERRRLVASQA